jgi:hypothetical protein
MLTATLGRELADAEFLAVASLWPQGHWASADAVTANRVLRDAFARFAAAEPDRDCHWRARRITASRWAISAMPLLRRGFLRQAACHLWYALLWHPLGLAATASSIKIWLLLQVNRKFRPST